MPIKQATKTEVQKQIESLTRVVLRHEEAIVALRNQVQTKQETQVQPGGWKPKDGEDYFWTDTLGTTYHERYYEGFRARWDRGLVFRTKEEAEREDKRRVVMQKLKDLALAAGEIKGAWFYLIYDNQNKKWQPIPHNWSVIPGQPKFSTLWSAQQAIKELGAELDVLL